MGLRPAVVDDVLHPGAGSRLLHPEDAIVVSQRGDDVGPPVAIHIEHVNEPGLAEIEISMKLPSPGARVFRRFEPSGGNDDVGATVLVDIARADAMTEGMVVNHVRNEHALA